MTEVEFREAALAVMRNGTPSADDNLLGMEIDFDIRLAELDTVDAESVAVLRTDHAERLIRATCEPASGASLAAAVDAITREWLVNLRYGYTEAHLAEVSASGATFDFVTQIEPGGLYVTGQVAFLARD